MTNATTEKAHFLSLHYTSDGCSMKMRDKIFHYLILLVISNLCKLLMDQAKPGFACQEIEEMDA